MFPVGHVHKHDLLRVHEARAKMNLENGSGEWLKRLYFLRKAVAAMVVLIGVLDAIDPGKQLVCLSIGNESLAAALDMHCCHFGN